MCQCALLDVLEMCRRAAEAAHACVHQNLDRVGILLHNLDDAHIFGNRHNDLLWENTVKARKIFLDFFTL